jgi:hypothetical protein
LSNNRFNRDALLNTVTGEEIADSDAREILQELYSNESAMQHDATEVATQAARMLADSSIFAAHHATLYKFLTRCVQSPELKHLNLDNCYLESSAIIALFTQLALKWSKCEIKEYDPSKNIDGSIGLTYLSLNHNIIGNRGMNFIVDTLTRYYYCHSLRHMRICMTRSGLAHAKILKYFLHPIYGQRLFVLEQAETELSLANSLMDDETASLMEPWGISINNKSFYLKNNLDIYNIHGDAVGTADATMSKARRHKIFDFHPNLKKYVFSDECYDNDDSKLLSHHPLLERRSNTYNKKKQEFPKAYISPPFHVKTAFISSLVAKNQNNCEDIQYNKLKLPRDAVRSIFNFLKTPIEQVYCVRNSRTMDMI